MELVLCDLAPHKLLLDPDLPLDPSEAIDALRSGLLPLPRPAPRRRAPPADGPVEVVAAAGRALVLAPMATLVDYYGQGRKLTKKAQPTTGALAPPHRCGPQHPRGGRPLATRPPGQRQ